MSNNEHCQGLVHMVIKYCIQSPWSHIQKIQNGHMMRFTDLFDAGNMTGFTDYYYAR